jgi:hypothetical protein
MNPEIVTLENEIKEYKLQVGDMALGRFWLLNSLYS